MPSAPAVTEKSSSCRTDRSGNAIRPRRARPRAARCAFAFCSRQPDFRCRRRARGLLKAYSNSYPFRLGSRICRIGGPARGLTLPVRALNPRPLRSHQRQLAGVIEAIASGRTDARDILAAVTPGGGKSLLPVIAAARLVASGWSSGSAGWCRATHCACRPRRPLPIRRGARRSAIPGAAGGRQYARTRAAGLAGYITTYQGIAAAPDLHLREFRRHRTLLVIDEVHHLPALAEIDPETASQISEAGEDPASAWSRAILPLLECAAVRLLLSGTLERADGRGILWLPYRKGPQGADARDRARRAGLGGDRLLAGARRCRKGRCCRSPSARSMARPSGAPKKASRSGRIGSPPPIRPRPPARRCSRRCAPASRRRCCGRRLSASATCAPAGDRSAALLRARPPRVWASCWWSRPTRRTRSGISKRSRAGFPATRPGKWRRWRRRTRRAPTRPSPPSDCSRSPRSW